MKLRHRFRRSRKKGYTLLIMPDNGKTVLSMRLPKAVLYTLLLVILVVCAVLYAAFHVQHLYQENLSISSQQKQKHLAEKQQLQGIIQSKDDEIAALQEQLFSLSEQADDVKSKLKLLEQLEQEIRVMVDSKVEGKEGQVKIASAEKISTMDISQQGGPFEPLIASDIDELAQSAQQSLTLSNEQIGKLLDRLAVTKRKWMDYEEMLQITPSIYPTDSTRITSSFGTRRDPFTGYLSRHNGLDFGAPLRSSVFATADGKVYAAGYDSARGNYVYINHENGLQTRYLHLSSYKVKSGQKVAQGDVIGYVGSTGRSTGPHLHYEVIKYGKPVDPADYLQPPRKEH